MFGPLSVECFTVSRGLGQPSVRTCTGVCVCVCVSVSVYIYICVHACVCVVISNLAQS